MLGLNLQAPFSRYGLSLVISRFVVSSYALEAVEFLQSIVDQCPDTGLIRIDFTISFTGASSGTVPQGLIDEMAAKPKGKRTTKGVEIAGHMIKEIGDRKMCEGVHIMAIGKEDVVPDIMSAAVLTV
jgi:hypothetical protein